MDSERNRNTEYSNSTTQIYRRYLYTSDLILMLCKIFLEGSCFHKFTISGMTE
jgi:hypothetical protein